MSKNNSKIAYRILYTVILTKILIIKTIYKYFKKVVTLFFRLSKVIIRYIGSFELKLKIFSIQSLFLIIISILSYITIFFYINIYIDLPESINLDPVLPRLTTEIYDRKGNLLYEFYKDENRSLITLSKVPQALINSTISIEDKDFYKHNGISISGIIRAFKKTVFNNDVEGGSTITQQLVKNKLLSNQRTLIRKIREIILALKLERKYSKDKILEMYFNEINYGGTSFGVVSAARTYFNKDLKDLNLPEIAVLAGLPASPSLYSPYNNPELTKKRQLEVLNRMYNDGYISKIELESAETYPIIYADQRTNIKYPHFVNYVKAELEKKFGKTLVEQGGLKVFTSIDPSLQDQAQKIVFDQVNKMTSHNVHNGAALITNPQTGEVLAMVGSKNFWDKSIDGNVNITVAKRQPGSSIKPINYSLAFEMGFKPTDKILDEPVIYKQQVPPDFAPSNYDHKFHGLVTLTQALANSYNVPAVKLLNELGIDNFINHATKMGISTFTDRSRYGLSITLGAGEVMMVDMNTVYSAFANEGKKTETNPFLKVLTHDGRIIYSNDCIQDLSEPLKTILSESTSEIKEKCTQDQVISQLTAYEITNILSDNKARSSAFGINSNLSIKKKKVAVKTGTTSYEKDNWAIGYARNYLVSTWIGNNNNQKMFNIQSGYISASIIWRSIFDYIIDNFEVDDSFKKPDGYIEVTVCPITSTLACNGCDNVKELVKASDANKKPCDYNLLNKLKTTPTPIKQP